MKKLAITENCYLMFSQCYIRASRKLFIILSKTIPFYPECLSQCNFYARILASDAAHVFVTSFSHFTMKSRFPLFLWFLLHNLSIPRAIIQTGVFMMERYSFITSPADLYETVFALSNPLNSSSAATYM